MANHDDSFIVKELKELGEFVIGMIVILMMPFLFALFCEAVAM